MRTIQPNKLPNNVPQFIGLADGRVSLYPGGAPLPPAPTGFQVYAILPPGVGGNQTITFEWSSYTFPGGLVDPGFVIERATSLAGPWTEVGTANENDTTINLTDAYDPTSAYYFRIRAVDFSGSFVSAWSNVVTVPAAPTLSTWAAVSDTEIEYAAAAGAWSQFNWAYGTDQTTWPGSDTGLNGTISGLDPGTLYYGTVQGEDASGNLSLWATPLSATTVEAPPSITATADTFYGSKLTVSAGAAAPTGYRYNLWRSTNGSVWTSAGTIAAGNDTLNDTGLTPETAYYYRASSTRLSDGVESSYSYLGGGASPGSTVTTAWDPSVNSASAWDSIEGAALAGRLWQNTGKTTPAVADGDIVRVFTDATGKDWTAASDAASPLLKIESGVYSLLFDGINDSLACTAISALGTAFTVGTAIKPAVTTRGDVLTRATALNTTNDVFDLLYGLTSGKPEFYIGIGTAGFSSGVGSTAMSAGSFYRIAGTCSGGTRTVYLDNVSQASASSGTVNNSATLSVRLGDNGGNSAPYSGRSQALAVFPSSLDSTARGKFDTWLAGAQS